MALSTVVTRGFEPTYLHFLDSQLPRLLERFPRAPALVDAVRACLICRGGPLYCSLSALWESPVARNRSMALLLRAVAQAGWLHVYAHQTSMDDFLQSRVDLYGHDRDRYGMYFETGLRPPVVSEIQAKATDTSEVLDRGTWTYLSRTDRRLLLPRPPTFELPTVQRLVERVLRDRGAMAMTATLFDSLLALGQRGRTVRSHLALVMSSWYLVDYVDAGSGVILTGIPGLSVFERPVRDGFPEADAPLLSAVVTLLGLRKGLGHRPISWWRQLLELRHTPVHAEFVGRVCGLLRQAVEPSPPDAALAARRSVGLGLLGRAFFGVADGGEHWARPETGVARSLIVLEKAQRRLRRMGGDSMDHGRDPGRRRAGDHPLVVFQGQVSDSSVVVGGHDLRIDSVTVGPGPLRAFSEHLRDSLPAIRETADEDPGLDEDLAIVEAHLRGDLVPEPRRRAAVERLRTFALGLAGNAAFTRLVALARQTRA